MNSVGELIAYQDQDFLLLTKQSRTKLQVEVMRYLFRASSSQQLSEAFKDDLNWSGQDCIDFRKKLGQSGYLQKNFKLYLYARIVGERVRAEEYGVPDADVKFAAKILSSKAYEAVTLHNFCIKAYNEGYLARSLDNFDRGLFKALMSLKKDAYIQKFVKKKHKFLTQSGQKDEESIHAELTEFGLKSAYRAYPRIDGLLHLINIMKTGIHNRGQNIIKEETTQKRKRVIKNEDGTYSGTLLSLDFSTFEQTFAQEQIGTGSLNTCNSLMCGMDGQSCEYERPSDVDRRRDLRQVVDKLMTQAKGESSKKFINLLMGLHDEEFSEWLGQPNDEASSKMARSDYVEKVRKFMRVPRPRARQFVSRLKKELADFRN